MVATFHGVAVSAALAAAIVGGDPRRQVRRRPRKWKKPSPGTRPQPARMELCLRGGGVSTRYHPLPAMEDALYHAPPLEADLTFSSRVPHERSSRLANE